MSEGNHGGPRPGAGRKKSENPPRTLHGLKFTDEEWNLIQSNVAMRSRIAKRRISTREYLWELAKKDLISLNS